MRKQHVNRKSTGAFGGYAIHIRKEMEMLRGCSSQGFPRQGKGREGKQAESRLSVGILEGVLGSMSFIAGTPFFTLLSTTHIPPTKANSPGCHFKPELRVGKLMCKEMVQ